MVISTMTQILDAKREENKPLLHFIKPDRQINYFSPQELYNHAISIAAILQKKVAPGDRVLILLPPGFEFTMAMYGCLYAGVIAVPAFPPLTIEMSKRIITFIQDANIKAVMVNNEIEKAMKLSNIFAPLVTVMHKLSILNAKSKRKHLALNTASKLNIINVSKIKIIKEEEFQPVKTTADTIAYIQYTSGSTSTPKGVVIKHKQMLANFMQIEKLFRLHKGSTVVSWLPPYHDMGLITNVFLPLYVGYQLIQMAPFTFIQQPHLLLETISAHKATVMGGPDFSYRYCIERVPEVVVDKLDLSHLEVVFSGAEKVQIDTLKKFQNKFSRCGLKENIFLPGYGLAEATLLVSGKIASLNNISKSFKKQTLLEKQVAHVTHASEPDRCEIVSVGRPVEGTDLLIMDPNNFTVKLANHVGEIVVTGNNVMDYYWEKEEATRNSFVELTFKGVTKRYLRTGDLGFIFENELYIVGRIKEIIIIAGKNHYPQDIELSVEHSNQHLKIGGIAAFSVEENSEERLIIVSELKENKLTENDFKKIIQHILQAISSQHFIQPFEVLLVNRGSLPKTTSGKIKRLTCKQLYTANQFPIVYRYPCV